MKKLVKKIIAAALAVTTIFSISMAAGPAEIAGLSSLALAADEQKPDSCFQYEVIGDHHVRISRFTDENATSVTIPEKTSFGYDIVAISVRAFLNNQSLRSVDLGKIQAVYSYAFYNCGNIKEITIPETVTKLEYGAFSNMNGLEKVTVNGSVTKMGAEESDGVFMNCKNLKEVTFNGETTDIGCNTFKNCEKLETVKLPSAITQIKASAFSGCKSLRDITIPDKVRYIKEKAFLNCSSLKEIKIPDSVASIYEMAFYGCSAAESIEFGSGLKLISENAFDGCSGVEKLVIPKSVFNIRPMAFANMTRLKEVTSYGEITHMGYCIFSGCENLETVYFDEGLIAVGNDIFEYCDSLKTAHFPASVKKENIDENAFGYADCDYTICSTSESNDIIAFAKETGHSWRVCTGQHPESKVTGVSISDIALEYRESAKLNPEIEAEGNPGYTVKFESSDEKVASVDRNGKVTANDKGTAVITCTVTDEYGNSVSDTCTVTVSKALISVIISMFKAVLDTLFGWIKR